MKDLELNIWRPDLLYTKKITFNDSVLNVFVMLP